MKPQHCRHECDCGSAIHAKTLCRKHYDEARGDVTNGLRHARRRHKRTDDKRPTRSAEAWVDLIAAIPRETTKLNGACKSLLPSVFDGKTAADVAEALDACARCPVLDACRARALTKASGVTRGVVGGLVLDAPARGGVLAARRPAAHSAPLCGASANHYPAQQYPAENQGGR